MPSEIQLLQERIGYEFRQKSLLESALTHSSSLPAGEVRTAERLEFLGDAVVDLAIADLLLGAFPACDEGQLSRLRSLLVRTSSLAGKARQFGLGTCLKLGRGEDRSGGRTKASILAAAYESVIGAIFLDGGFDRAHAVVRRHFECELREGGILTAQDWKTMLQERLQADLRRAPEYVLLGESGPAHEKKFIVQVKAGSLLLSEGEGPSKREAEQQAARGALSTAIWEAAENAEAARS